jgi:acetoin:2,6-dichlorophenolindophenol oxidoreductase subunit beta
VTQLLPTSGDFPAPTGGSPAGLAVAAEELGLAGPPRRVTRPDGAALPFALNPDVAVQPGQDQLRTAIQVAVKARW